MAGSIPGPTTVRSFGFNIPCRRFLIRANVMRDRRLPVVDEFVLRTLKLCEDVPVRRLASYFGFSAAETEMVMADLTSAGLVVLEGDTARLHPSAHELFRGPKDAIPLVVEVDSWVERLWFDLVSKNMAKPDRTRSARNLIDIRPTGMARDLPGSYAKKAFEDNFAEYLRKVRRMANPDRFTLYSVSESIPERFGSLVFRMDEDLVFDPEPRLRPNLIAIEAEDALRFRPLATAMLDAYRKLNWIQASAAALAEFSGLSGETTVTDAYSGTARFDLTKWLSLNPDRKNPDRQNIIGASYIRRNVDFLAKLIDNLPKPASVEASSEREIVWYRPGGSGWGCSPELQEAILAIKFALRRRFGKVSIRTKLICPTISRRDHPDRFRNLFDEGHIAPPGFLSPAVEVIHIPAVATLMLVAVALSESVEIPVGFASVAADPLNRVTRRLAQVDARFEELWRSEKREEEGPIPIEPEIEDVDDT
ncbi:MAG: hypothetical protein K2Y71_29620 [Xanthobacteraceae bacterium]|nr:hypothetical protein [Xanthobacteraceae bacterium]